MKLKKLLSILTHRTVVVALLMLAQLGLLAAMILRFSEYFVYFYFFGVLVSLLAVLHIVNKKGDPGYKIAWIVPILLLPLFGGFFYLFCGGNGPSTATRKKMRLVDRRMAEILSPDQKAEKLTAFGRDSVSQSRYLERYAHCPLYTNTDSRYYAVGDDAFTPMLQALRDAKRYIFLEYFIITPGKFWDSVLKILEEKAAQGVDVRVIYDDVGCLYTLPKDYAKTLKAKGIRCQVFNRFVPILSIRLNNRDHRKFCIVDGHTAFTGGINLADEYINAIVRYGHWKDCAIRLRGEAVWSMTVMFLTMWESISAETVDYQAFRPSVQPLDGRRAAGQWVQPYADSPLDQEPVGETVYLNLINKAKGYVYIMTPYLIISDSLNTALCSAAKSGVDVRILTPHVPDKKTVFEMTKAHYTPLLEAGVRIFEYTPGFLHSKCFAVDDRWATVGTVNLDYRSLFLHFENGVWLCGGPTVLSVRDDFLNTQEKSQEVTLRQAEDHSFFRLLFRAVLRVFAPLM